MKRRGEKGQHLNGERAALLAVLLLGAVAGAQPTPAGAQPTAAGAQPTAAGAQPQAANLSAQTCASANTVVANVVALNQVLIYNRLGARQQAGMVFALQQDVISTDSNPTLRPGKARLRSGKRPRPLVLRVNQGECLRIEFTNLLQLPEEEWGATSTVEAGVTAMGLNLDGAISSSGAFTGKNASALIAPGSPTQRNPVTNRPYTIAYTYKAAEEGTFLLFSSGADYQIKGNGSQLSAGLFGAVIVEPARSEWYRSQVTAADLALATRTRLPNGLPSINYDAVYPPGYKRPEDGGTPVPANTPILRMRNAQNEIVYSDLTAVITGPARGPLAVNYPPNPALPDRRQPFREFTTIYHEDFASQEGLPQFNEGELSNVLGQGWDNFGINYGMGGIGAEVLANRLGVGPAADCVECKFEEFFLSSWSGGDPAMVVDVPVDVSLQTGRKATKASYPEDPSNVYHSYLNDHVRFRVLHGGSKLHHIHHLHAHQWLHTSNSDNSAYLDSQAIGPGSGYTMEITYNGSGNANRTPGDSIFHCHFYPHFAAGMWALWRVHDVFEAGTQMDGKGMPIAGARALPDGEIAAGTAIPAVVPLPTLTMPPPPAPVSLVKNAQGRTVVSVNGPGNPGYPFFIPGVAGGRPPHPPMDFAVDRSSGQPVTLNGGLPRHIILGGEAPINIFNYQNFTKDNYDPKTKRGKLNAQELPEDGTAAEKAAMAFHAQPSHASFRPDGTQGTFATNGLTPKPGAPIADPCPTGTSLRHYRGAAFQTDVVFNKKGWHFPQQRMLALWSDVLPTINRTRAPEPLFFRANSEECIEYWHTNLVPDYYELDDFQVRTPTDILGQHIHLVKFDVLASDGAANGWNYEDGTFSPEEVRNRISAINNVCASGATNCGLASATNPNQRRTLTPQEPPKIFGKNPEFIGAQTTVQRWWADPLLNNKGQDRTLRTVFTHDHFGPSTHQQAGLYAGLLVEPKGSKWLHPETGRQLGVDSSGNPSVDGAPTSFQAYITPASASANFGSYREFAVEFQDLQLAYQRFPDGGSFPNAALAINAPDPQCPKLADGGTAPAPCPQLISQPGLGTAVVNYRDEPLPFRVQNPDGGGLVLADSTDLSQAYRSITRMDEALNKQPDTYPALTRGVQGTDPYTPLLRAYEGEDVQVRVLVGAHSSMHNFNMQGLRWLFEPSEPNSGYRSSQAMGISEHFEFLFRVPVTANAVAPQQPFTDYLYEPSTSPANATLGTWGLMRAYQQPQRDLLPAPKIRPPADPSCPPGAPVRAYSVTAINSPITYTSLSGRTVTDPNGLVYMRSEDVVGGKPKSGARIEPLVLRAVAGECIRVTLTNAFDTTASVFNTADTNDPSGAFPNYSLYTSRQVGLRPQLVSYDMRQSSGFNAGFNPVTTVAPGSSKTYTWYAGTIARQGTSFVGTPVEFGTINLLTSDPLEQHPHSLVGALIIEPVGSTWREDANTRTSATVIPSDGSPAFREFVLMAQESLQLTSSVQGIGTFQAFNYGSSNIDFRYGAAVSPSQDIACANSNRLQETPSTSPVGDPSTPVFAASAGMPVRFRMAHPRGMTNGGASGNGTVFMIEGHAWQEEPYQAGSTRLASNPASEIMGSRMGHGPGDHFDVLIPAAGGSSGVQGDYLYRNFTDNSFWQGAWGLFRVSAPGKDSVTILSSANGQVTGQNSVYPAYSPSNPAQSGTFAPTVGLFSGTPTQDGSRCMGFQLGQAQVNPTTGQWSQRVSGLVQCAQSSFGGVGIWRPNPGPACTPSAPSVAVLKSKPPAKALLPHVKHALQRAKDLKVHDSQE
jgi:hypothetical protein